jgi:hypothetical protein
VLLTNFQAPGRAHVVLSLDTGSYLGTVVKRMPFTFENPAFGKPVAELPLTAELRAQNPNATVVELYQGASLPQFGIPSYDGARDVYFGDGRKEKGYGGSCTNLGTGLSYGDDLRFQLHLGGEDRRSLIKFDLAMLPADAKVAKAILVLHVESFNPKADLAARVIALKRRWSETVVGVLGGLNATNSPTPPPHERAYPVGTFENWDEPLYRGPGDCQPGDIASAAFGRKGWVALDITRAVKNWVGGLWLNRGLAIELPNAEYRMGTHDVRISASDYPVDAGLRPRLVLVLEGNVKPVGHQVREVNADLKAALAQASEKGKPVLVNVLSAGSLTSRRFETQVLNGVPEVAKWIAKNFIEVRLDADKPDHKEFLLAHGVRRVPSALVLTPEGARAALLEPFDWDCPRGLMRSAFEFEQLYTRALGGARSHLVSSTRR